LTGDSVEKVEAGAGMRQPRRLAVAGGDREQF
jgi:hypothetical protein